ncbi:class I SAM-dependent methyltransferase [Bartonella sp. HY329]|uniref:class I SAM-dependent methyltransferase n=1 Tax=unclassified Bartonella TaxID=2645622 RepID=UPI0021C97AD1|nr:MULTISPECIES: class I SAM-dependent methyltransferase [unclassified Bartonella]UXM94892.1 class I SAM-dependent methyltransferase [Bartonella sp. HY329]UXN09215.1 class I SAM-dependent methyltransferase [Bartonella sp. HY328]
MEIDNILSKLYADHNGKISDKWSIYIKTYHNQLSSYQDKDINMLEVGIQNGGSLEIWAKYFKNAGVILGCDIDPKCANLKFDDTRINVLVGDISKPSTKERISATCTEFDIIIDDGSHKSSDIIATFCSYFPDLKDGGLFIIEDLHCSYWKNYEGGLLDRHSAIEFLKLLIDVVNFEHWGLPLNRTAPIAHFLKDLNLSISEETLSHIHSIQFINSLCIIKKAIPTDNELGKRVVAGLEALVDSEVLEHNNTKLKAPNEEVGVSRLKFFKKNRPILPF